MAASRVEDALDRTLALPSIAGRARVRFAIEGARA
jgi:hypothetical protein